MISAMLFCLLHQMCQALSSWCRHVVSKMLWKVKSCIMYMQTMCLHCTTAIYLHIKTPVILLYSAMFDCFFSIDVFFVLRYLGFVHF